MKKNFFWIFFRCTFWNFSPCTGFQSRRVVSNASLYKVCLQRIIVRQAVKFFKSTFWTIFFEKKSFFWIFFGCTFWNFSRCIGFQKAEGSVQCFFYKMGLQRIIVRQAVKIFKPTFWTIFFEKNFFFEFFFRCIFWNFSRCIGFQRRGVVSNAYLWSGLSADYSPTSGINFLNTLFEQFSWKKFFFEFFFDIFKKFPRCIFWGAGGGGDDMGFQRV